MKQSLTALLEPYLGGLTKYLMNNFLQFYQLVDYVHCKEAVGNLFPFWDHMFFITAVLLEIGQ